jgi:hypothetical protein
MDALNPTGSQDDFHAPIVDPAHFHGRRALLEGYLKTPWRVLILLGGRGIGKTSVLNQLEHMLQDDSRRIRMLPVRLNLNRERPTSTASFLHLLLTRLEEARRTDPPTPVPEVVTTQGFESHLQTAIAALRDRRFSGVCFLLDECEQLVGQDWWKGDASGVLRSLLETRAFAKQVGFVLTGFRALRDHRQKVGSRLMHEAAWEYLPPLTRAEVDGLFRTRCEVEGASPEGLEELYDQAGGHPKLTQRLVSLWLETRADDPRPSIDPLAARLRDALGSLFEDWWGENGYPGGLTGLEREVFRATLECETISASTAAGRTKQSENDCRQALQILQAIGVVIPTGGGGYRVGTRLFAEWARGKFPVRRPGKGPGGPRRKPFDVFLCHNSQDKPAVQAIAERLKARGLRPWFDEWELRPGMSWQKALEDQIGTIKAAAVFVGTKGFGPWQDLEQQAFLRQFVARQCPVIPVILADCQGTPPLPVFLCGLHWVDFRRAEPDPLEQLVFGITGRRE